MKRCPTCNKTFTEQHLTFCIDDGTPLVSVDESAAETSVDESTQVRSSFGGDSSRPSSSDSDDERAPAYQPPGSYVPPGGPTQKRRTWPWILGILVIVVLVIGGLAIAAAVLIPNMLRASSNRNINLNANTDRRGNLNERSADPSLNSNENDNDGANDNSDVEDTTPPPTDQEAVLAELKNLEDEWTVANINADKKKLNLILADDYVDTSEGRARGKAEYLKTIERNSSIQHWEFEDLQVSLKSDRASLTGILRLDVKDQRGQNQQLLFRFTDKFVWRDGRWQATASEVNALPVKPGTAV